MKKLLTFVLVAVMLFTVSTSVFADFVSSPSNGEAPEIVDVSSSDPDSNVRIIVTPYRDRASLPADLKVAIEKAYDSIKNASDLTVLNTGLAGLAEKMNVTTEGLAVSSLFDVRSEPSEFNGTITLKLKQKRDEFKNFVALLHYNYTDDKWEIVEGASVDGDYLTFSADSFSPFAVVVATDITNPPPTGVDILGLVAICTVLFAAAGVCLFVAVKKKRTNA